MKLLAHIRDRLRQAFGPAFMIVALAYFAYHALEGRYGLLALHDLNSDLAELEARAAEAAEKKQALEAKVSALRRDNLDLDLLDERARAVLGYTEADEITIYTPEDEN